MSEEKKLDGLGGWLILVGIGIVISPVRIIALIFPVYAEMFTNGSWEVLTTPGSEAYNPLWAPILIGEIVINISMALVWLFVAFQFFTKKALFPTWYIGIMLFTLGFIVVDALAIKLVMPNESIFDPETTKEFLRTLVAAAIWIPYMLMSKRVKATFVK